MVKVLYDCQTPFGEGVVQTGFNNGDHEYVKFQSPRGEGVVQTYIPKVYVQLANSFNHLAVRGWFRLCTGIVFNMARSLVSITSR